ncbi:MAG: D-alanyl-D-alanine carboxypeptidase [Eubacteriaceae bacterium]|nr:D-alanyl-D-alanine carboxypeptidase [Eubacteriaceae bacterium]
MRKLLLFLCGAAALAFCLYGGNVEAASKASVVIEAKTLVVLEEHNAYARLPMASTTKAMTAIVAIEEGNLEEMVSVSARAAGVGGSSMYLKEGDKIRLGELIAATLFVSANDGTVAIAEHIDGSMEKFVERMNRKAFALGLKDTHFANTHGLTQEGHYTTAYDLACIMAYAIQNETFYKIVSAKNWPVTVNGETHTYTNKDQFLYRYEYAVGGKTGSTNAAGRCFVSAAEQDGMTLCGAVLNSSDIYGESIAMMKRCFASYTLENMGNKGEYMATIPIEGGRAKTYQLSFQEDLYVPVLRKDLGKARIELNYVDYLVAPVRAGQVLGRYYVILGQKVLYQSVIRAPKLVRKKGSTIEEFFSYFNKTLNFAF